MAIRIIIDDKIPFIRGVLEEFCDVEYCNGSAINAETVKAADALIIRTRTKCDANLLTNSSVKFIATATIGFDHIDTQFCDENGIHWTNAPGCNSGSVLQYIASVLSVLSIDKGYDLQEKTIGIVGVGNVGSKVEHFCRTIGMNVLLCDPPRKEKEGGEFVSIEKVLKKADIISFHVPLILEGKNKTYHLLNNHTLSKTEKCPVIINTSRGEVIHTESLKQALLANQISAAILDVWENEPDIDIQLLRKVYIGTPHIAGYSVDGKANGTAMSVQAISRFFNLPLSNWYPENLPEPEGSRILMYDIIENLILQTYNVLQDGKKLKEYPEKFEKFRGDYPVRREFSYYEISSENNSTYTDVSLQKIGFKI